MKFDFDKYKGKYAMHCKTEEEAKEFCKVMHDAGMKWRDGDSYHLRTSWDVYKENTTYGFNHGSYCRVQYFLKGGYTILEWNNFRKVNEMTKKELKTGMVVERRNGGKLMVLLDTPVGDALIGNGDSIDLYYYTNDLRNATADRLDIVAVYEPRYRGQMAPSFWDNQECIWRRSEVKEVTLSEIAEKFDVSVENIRVKEAVAIVEKWQKENMFRVPKDTPIDAEVLVSDDDGNWYPKHFAGFEGEKMCAWNDGTTSHTANYKISWKSMKLAEEEA